MRAFLAAHADGGLVALPTSGTSGSPRSVLRTTDSWVCSFGHVSALTGIDAGSRVWVPGPLTSTMNLFAAVHAMFVGARTVTSPTEATHAQLTPSALRRCLADGTDLNGMHMVVAGDRLDRMLRRQAVDAGAEVSHYYGAAELSFVAWGPHEDDLQPFPEVEVEVRDGLVWVRSPYLCHGYDGPPGPFRTAGDGFATVGDRGALRDGRLTVTGRGTDAITTSGVTVQAADVEHVLRQAGTGEVVVVGLPHRDLGAVVAAVLSRPHALTNARAAARADLPASHRPRRWFLVTDLPLTPAGKPDRIRLAAMLADEHPDVRRLT